MNGALHLLIGTAQKIAEAAVLWNAGCYVIDPNFRGVVRLGRPGHVGMAGQRPDGGGADIVVTQCEAVHDFP